MFYRMILKPYLKAAGLAAALTLGASASHAEPKPYTPLDATITQPQADAELSALQAALKAAVDKQDTKIIDAAVLPGFLGLTCSSDPRAACMKGARGVTLAAPASPPLARLRAATCCSDIPVAEQTPKLKNELMLGILGALLAEETSSIHPDQPGLVCQPALPGFDRAKAAQIAKAADVEPQNLRVASTELTLRAKPDKTSAEVLKIPAGRIVPLVTLGQEGLAAGWNAIALPTGGLGFSDQGGLSDLTPAALCFAKPKAGSWGLSLLIQRKEPE